MDQDPFDLARRPIAGGVSLEQWEDGKTYYLAGFGRDEGGGLVEGTVQQVGWNDRYVVAWRTPTFGGDGAGWMIVDAERGTVQGPFATGDLENHPEARPVHPLLAAQAWERLPTHAWRFWLFAAAVAAAVIRRKRSTRARKEPPMPTLASGT